MEVSIELITSNLFIDSVLREEPRKRKMITQDHMTLISSNNLLKHKQGDIFIQMEEL